MSDQITSCPEQEELRKCVFNQLPTNELEAIKAHVKMCPKCRVSFTTILKEKVAKENQGIGPIPPATKNVADSPLNRQSCLRKRLMIHIQLRKKL